MTHPTPLEIPLRRRKQIRFRGAPHTLLALPAPPLVDRRRKRNNGFDVAAALELNLDRYPTQDELRTLLSYWLNSAETHELGHHDPSYMPALKRALVIVS